MQISTSPGCLESVKVGLTTFLGYSKVTQVSESVLTKAPNKLDSIVKSATKLSSVSVL